MSSRSDKNRGEEIAGVGYSKLARTEAMWLFDRLPPALQSILRNTPFNMCPGWVYRQLRKGRPVEDVADELQTYTSAMVEKAYAERGGL
jgi:hypothetical protein